MHILITGASGLVGRALTQAWQSQGHAVTSLSRHRSENEQAWWDIDQQIIHMPDNPPIDAVVHLAGENIASSLRWTAAKKQRIQESRVQGTKLLCQTLAQLKHKPTCLISASAIGYYGSHTQGPVTENNPAGQGFLAKVCQAWEQATEPAIQSGIRVVHARLGAILSGNGGMLARMLPPFKRGLGGPLGHGQQIMSWIALEDVVRSFDFILNHPTISGPVNVTTPNPVTNETFTQILSHILNKPARFRIPTFAIQALFGELGKELLLASQNVIPQKLQQAGYIFTYPNIQDTLKHLLTPSP